MPEHRNLLQEWMDTSEQLRENGVCCYGSHFYQSSGDKQDENQDENQPKTWDPKPDKFVCPRERAWRNWVRHRDGNPDYPFVVENVYKC